MNKKSVFIIMMSFIGMLALAGSTTAAIKVAPLHTSGDADEQWTPLGYGLLGQDYTNPEHWWHDAVPTGLQKAKIDRVPGPIINGVVDINLFFVSQGNDDDPGTGKLKDISGPIQYPPCTATLITGADVNSRLVIVGYYRADHGTLQIDDGVMDVNSHMFTGYEGRGDLIMNGGTLNVYGNFSIAFQGGTGRVQLNGGTLHLKQFSYEYPYKEPNQWVPAEPNTLPHVGKASMDISGGQIIHDSNSTDGPGIPLIYWRMVNEGKLTACNGLGSVLIAYDPCTYQTTVTGQKMLWNYGDITVTSNSVMDNDATYGLDRMFDVNGADGAIFLSSGVGAVYEVNWKTPAPVTVSSFEMVANRDDVNNLNHRALSRFVLKAKSIGSSTYNLTLADKNINYPTGSDVNDLVVSLDVPVIAQEFRAEFTGADVNGPRINKLNATGTRSVEQLWNLGNGDITIIGNSPVINDPNHPGMFDLGNMFESGSRDANSTIFSNGTGAGYVYFVEFGTVPETINSIKLVTERDANTHSRATTHFKLKSKSLGSAGWDAVPLYDGDIDYATGDVNTLVITLSTPVTAQQFRAEFTGGNDANGVRVRELDAIGIKKGEQLWEPENIVIGDHSATDWRAGYYNIENAFQKEGVVPDSNYISALFWDLIPGSGEGTIDSVEWKTRSSVQVTGFQLVATHDPFSAVPSYGRAMTNFKLWTKSAGSSTFDVLVYDSTTTIAPPYRGSPDGNTLNLYVTLATPITAREFRAEFTRYASSQLGSGVRVGELNAFGYKLPTTITSLDSDNDIDFKDFALFAQDWLVDNSGATPTTTVLDDFESGIGNWSNWASHTDSQNYNFFYPETGTVHGGSGSMRWTYDLNPSIVLGDDDSGLVFTAATTIDIKNFSKFRVWLYRQAGNSNENYLAVKFYWPGLVNDSRIQAAAFILSANGSTKTPSSLWSEWVVDFKTDLAFQNSTIKSIDDMSKVGSIVLEVCNRLNFVGGQGTIYVDDMALTSRCTGPAADFNNDCKVDIDDLAIFCDSWLTSD